MYISGDQLANLQKHQTSSPPPFKMSTSKRRYRNQNSGPNKKIKNVAENDPADLWQYTALSYPKFLPLKDYYGKVVTINGDTWVLLKINPNRPQYPVSASKVLEPSRQAKFTLQSVIDALPLSEEQKKSREDFKKQEWERICIARPEFAFLKQHYGQLIVVQGQNCKLVAIETHRPKYKIQVKKTGGVTMGLTLKYAKECLKNSLPKPTLKKQNQKVIDTSTKEGWVKFCSSNPDFHFLKDYFNYEFQYEGSTYKLIELNPSNVKTPVRAFDKNKKKYFGLSFGLVRASLKKKRAKERAIKEEEEQKEWIKTCNSNEELAPLKDYYGATFIIKRGETNTLFGFKKDKKDRWEVMYNDDRYGRRTLTIKLKYLLNMLEDGEINKPRIPLKPGQREVDLKEGQKRSYMYGQFVYKNNNDAYKNLEFEPSSSFGKFACVVSTKAQQKNNFRNNVVLSFDALPLPIHVTFEYMADHPHNNKTISVFGIQYPFTKGSLLFKAQKFDSIEDSKKVLLVKEIKFPSDYKDSRDYDQFTS